MGRIFCANGMYELKINPGEFLIFLAPKYEGSEKQKMRVRLRFGGSIYLSQPYEGTFNPKQLRMKDKTLNKTIYENDNVYAINGIFYGSIPMEYVYPKRK